MSQDELEELADEFIDGFLSRVIDRSLRFVANDPVARALQCFLVRSTNTWRTISTLHSHDEPKRFAIDTVTLLRAQMDAYYQAEHIANAREGDTHARDYLDYEHVERWKNIRSILRAGNWIAQLQASPNRESGERSARENFDAVEGRFRIKADKSKHRLHWYRGTLRDIAEQVGKSDEYDTLLALMNGSVHSSAYTASTGPPIPADSTLLVASKFAVKTASLCVIRNGLDLSPSYARLVEVMCNSDGQ